jgi:hypothetical protein
MKTGARCFTSAVAFSDAAAASSTFTILLCGNSLRRIDVKALMDVRPKVLLAETMEKECVPQESWVEGAQLRLEIARTLVGQDEHSSAAFNCE